MCVRIMNALPCMCGYCTYVHVHNPMHQLHHFVSHPLCFSFAPVPPEHYPSSFNNINTCYTSTFSQSNVSNIYKLQAINVLSAYCIQCTSTASQTLSRASTVPNIVNIIIKPNTYRIHKLCTTIVPNAYHRTSSMSSKILIQYHGCTFHELDNIIHVGDVQAP